MSKDGLYTEGNEDFSPRVNSIPLSDVDSTRPGETSMGQLVSNVSQQVSSLVRSEIELAKTELTQSAKRGGTGVGLFIAAGVIALYSTFFLFFFTAELLDIWLDRWAAFLIVFLVMLVVAGILAFIGLTQVKKVRKPEKTIESVNELKSVVPSKSKKAVEGTKNSTNTDGLYT